MEPAGVPVHAITLCLRDLPPSERALVVLDAERRSRIVDAAVDAGAAGGAMVLATCHRVEVYVAAPHGEHDAVGRALAAARDALGPRVAGGAPWRRYDGEDAAEHLFRVACGLESPIVGDHQVLGQVRGAFREACHRHPPSPVLYELCRRALELGRRVRAETAIGAGGVGIGTAVADTVDDRLGHRARSARVVVVGAGDAARAVLKELSRRGLRGATVVNRSPASGLAASVGMELRVRPLAELREWVAGADVVIGAVAGCPPRLDAATLAACPGTPLVIDVGQPRCTSTDLDGRVVLLDALVDGMAPATRRAAIPEVAVACADATASFCAWASLGGIESALRGLYRDVEATIGALARELDTTGERGVDRVLRHRLLATLHPHVAELRRRSTDLVGAGRGRGGDPWEARLA